MSCDNEFGLACILKGLEIAANFVLGILYPAPIELDNLIDAE